MTKKFALTSEERKVFDELQRTVKEKWQYVRITTLILISDNYKISEIQKILGIDDNTIDRYVTKFLENQRDVEALLDRNYTLSKVNASKLDTLQLELLKAHLESNFYTTSKEICNWVEKEFKIKYAQNSIIEILHNLGFSYKKTKQIPVEVDLKKQIEFVKLFQELNQKILDNSENSVVYFTDAVHPTHNTRSTYGWIKTGEEKELETVSGRDRVNVNGAVNANDPIDVITIQGETINSQNTKELYQKILDKNPNKDIIYIITDNARYYKNKELNQWLETTKIKQLFLPTYSPNLNIIERLWKFLRKKVINSNFYRTKLEFENAITQFFENISQYQDELKSLLTLNFHIFKNSQSV